MSRIAILVTLVCAAAPAQASPVTREPLGDGLAHYTYTVPVGDGPNARLAIHRVVGERAPWWPRASGHAVMLLHGDFARWDNEFGALSSYLARAGIDAWSVDARWTQAPAEGADLSDFADMGLAQRVADTELALSFARATRLVTGSGLERLTLVGFSSGAHVAYVVASVDGARPAWRRNVGALAPIDIAPVLDPADADAIAAACFSRDLTREAFDAGLVDGDNFFQIELGTLALSDPDGPSPNPRFTNLGRMRNFVGRTWLFLAPTPFYHLAAPVLTDGLATALRESTDEAMALWLAGAPPHQAMREALDLVTLVCGEGPLPVDAPLDRIRVPLFYVGAAGGYAALGLYATAQVSSTDVTVLMLAQPGLGELEQTGHADLLFAADAPQRVFAPLAAWILGR